MRPVRRDEIVDLQRYEEGRDAFRTRVFAVKAARRVHLGEVLTFLFENRDTVRYQVQEMIRAERLWRDEDIQRELDTYNELLGGEGELGATLLIELEDPAERARLLRLWRDLPEHLYALLEDGRRVRPRVDERQRDAERLSAVQFLRFPTGGAVPVALGSDLKGLAAEARLSDAQRAALAEDLRG
jgi:hypothetical protein